LNCLSWQEALDTIATQLVHAISILDILAGTIDRPGGRYFPRAASIAGVDAVYPPLAASESPRGRWCGCAPAWARWTPRRT
jgi:anaerobic selenocysteine-containing dehydrogenase